MLNIVSKESTNAGVMQSGKVPVPIQKVEIFSRKMDFCEAKFSVCCNPSAFIFRLEITP